MPTIETLIIFTAAAIVMNLSPGPSNFYVMSRGIAQGPKAGMIAAFRLAAGSLIHVVAAALGLSALFVYSPTAYFILKLAGAGYLIYLGIRYIVTAKAADALETGIAKRSNGKIFRESVLIEVLNPKTALFFIAFLPQFVDPALGAIIPQFLLLGLIVSITALPCDFLVAFASGWVGKQLTRRPYLQRIQDWISGSILVGLGLYVLVDQRKT